MTREILPLTRAASGPFCYDAGIRADGQGVLALLRRTPPITRPLKIELQERSIIAWLADGRALRFGNPPPALRQLAAQQHIDVIETDPDGAPSPAHANCTWWIGREVYDVESLAVRPLAILARRSSGGNPTVFTLDNETDGIRMIRTDSSRRLLSLDSTAGWVGSPHGGIVVEGRIFNHDGKPHPPMVGLET